MKNLMQKGIRLLRKALLTELLATQLADIRNSFGRSVRDGDSCGSKLSQLLLLQNYQALARARSPLPTFAEVEFRAFSQNGEDGILLYLFALFGMGSRRVVEICSGDGMQCNAANLVINHGWNALLFDGDLGNIDRAKHFYATHPDTRSFPPHFVQTWITRENINALISENGYEGEIDLLSLDLDGNDYWIWEALDVIRPRVVVAEVQCIWGADRAVTVPYDPHFRTELVDGFGVYSGASLSAFVKLAARKGYRLVGVQRLGFNAFFVRGDLGQEILPAADPVTCLTAPFAQWAQRTLLPLVKDRPWVDV